jgi:large-conductance mechanosensitive channel
VLAAVFNYELNKVLYTSAAPASLFEYSVLVAILPFLLAAILSFVVAVLGSQAAKAADEKEPEMQEKKMAEPEMQNAETQETEDVFKETPT